MVTRSSCGNSSLGGRKVCIESERCSDLYLASFNGGGGGVSSLDWEVFDNLWRLGGRVYIEYSQSQLLYIGADYYLRSASIG